MTKLFILFFSVLLPMVTFSKQTREPASKVKGIPNSFFSCSNAMADHGYVVNIVTKKQKTTVNVSESTFVGSIHKADLSCLRTKGGPQGGDQIYQTLLCESETSSFKVEQYAGGFAGLVTVDIYEGDKLVGDDIICHRL